MQLDQTVFQLIHVEGYHVSIIMFTVVHIFEVIPFDVCV